MPLEVLITAAVFASVGAAVGYAFALRTKREAAFLAEASEREAFERGRTAGAEQERALLEVCVEPYHATESEYFGMKKVLSVGYSHQIYYRGLPVGDPQRILTHVESTWDDEVVDKVLALATAAAKAHVATLARGGVPARLGK